MAPLPKERTTAARAIRAPRGAALSCKGWAQEAALRLLMNSADPSVAEEAEHLIPSGGVGKLARDEQTLHSILEALQTLEKNQTLLIRRGEPAAVIETREDAPRVVVANAELAKESRGAAAADIRLERQGQTGRYAADWMFTGPTSALPEAVRIFGAAARMRFGGSLAGRLVVSAGMGGMGGAQALAVTMHGGAFLGIDADSARIKRREKAGFCEVMVNNVDEALRILKNAVRKSEPASVGLVGNAADVLPELARRGVLPDLLTDQTPADDPSGGYIPRGITLVDAREIQQKDPHAYRQRALDSIAAQAGAMLEMKRMGATVFAFGNGIRAQALACGVASAGEIPDFISEYLQTDLAQGRGLLTLIALSGDPADLAPLDAACLELFPQPEMSGWLAASRKHRSAGLPARSFWMTASEGAKLGEAMNEIVRNGTIQAPVALGRSIYVPAGVKPVADMAQRSASGAAAKAPGKAFSDSSVWGVLLQSSSGAAWLGVQAAFGTGSRRMRAMHFAAIADGTPAAAGRIGRAFANKPTDELASAAALFAS